MRHWLQSNEQVIKVVQACDSDVIVFRTHGIQLRLRGLGPERPLVPDSQSPEPAGGADASGWIGESGVRAASAA